VLHGQNNSVAMEMQLIKGVLPDLFAVLKFLESDDNLVFNSIICHYFVKKSQVVETKMYEWWKRNMNAVRKSIDRGEPLLATSSNHHSWVRIPFVYKRQS